MYCVPLQYSTPCFVFQITIFSRAQYRNENGQSVEEKGAKTEIIDVKANIFEYTTDVLPNTEYVAQMCTINRSGCGPSTNITSDTQCRSLSTGKFFFICI